MRGQPPCPAYVIAKNGRRYYCEAGPKGHYGTHAGSRPKAEYERLVAKVRARD